MKKFFTYIVFVTLLIAVTSCVLFDDKKSSSGNRGNEEQVDSTKTKGNKQYASIELTHRVDSLSGEIEKQNTELKGKLESMTLTAIVLSIIAIIANILILIRFKGVITEQIKCSLAEFETEGYLLNRVNTLWSEREGNKTKNNQQSNDQRKSGTNDNKQTAGQQQQSPATHQTPTEQIKKESQYQKVGYAKVGTGEYFTDTEIYDSNREGCVFKITFTNNRTEGKFIIISLDKIQSRNDWQKKVECSGISVNDASGFKIEEEGTCEIIDAEKTWKVTKPLKIKLLK